MCCMWHRSPERTKTKISVKFDKVRDHIAMAPHRISARTSDSLTFALGLGQGTGMSIPKAWLCSRWSVFVWIRRLSMSCWKIRQWARFSLLSEAAKCGSKSYYYITLLILTMSKARAKQHKFCFTVGMSQTNLWCLWLHLTFELGLHLWFDESRCFPSGKNFKWLVLGTITVCLIVHQRNHSCVILKSASSNGFKFKVCSYFFLQPLHLHGKMFKVTSYNQGYNR